MKLIPLVGLVVGAILVLIAVILTCLGLQPMIRGAVLTGVYFLITGGLHMDGLADTCDGVFSGRSREQSLEIMKDSRIGVFGTLGIFMAGLLYFAFMASAPLPALLVFPVCGRACCLLSASLAPYAREDGMGKGTVDGGGRASVAAAVISIVGASFLTIPLFLLLWLLETHLEFMHAALMTASFSLPPSGAMFAGGAAIIVTAWMTFRFRKKLGGITGDTLGAVIEVSSIVFLFAYIILDKVMPI